MEKFFRTHPEWRHTAPLPSGFHWKWYYAFQQLGDESAAPQVAAYRRAVEAITGKPVASSSSAIRSALSAWMSKIES